MKSSRYSLSMFLAISMFCSLVAAQQGATESSSATVPRLVNFSGKATDAQGKAISGIAGVTFAIYKDQYEGAPLWLETQNVQANAKGGYTVQLGATKPEGLPLDLFSSGEARWLGVLVNGGEEQPRVVLVSVPYALKALDAETLGGRPASAFMVTPPAGSKGSQRESQPAPAAEQGNEIVCSSGTACKSGFVPLFSSNGGRAKIVDSVITQSGGAITVAGSETVTSSASRPALSGTSSGTNAVSDGVDGVTGSATASGVAGINNGNGIGVYGTGGTGVFGTGTTGGQFVTSTGTALELTAGNGILLNAVNNEDGFAAVIQNFNTSTTFPVLFAGGFVGGNSTGCTVDINGNLACSGSKSAVVPVDNGSRKVALYAIEGPENWFEDAGSGQLSKGEAVVNLEAVFSQTVNTGINYQVFLTPNGDCKGLYVAQKTATSFVVRELGGGTSSIAFDYRFLAKRKGYESIRLADKTKVFDVPNHPRRSVKPTSAKSAVGNPPGSPAAQLANQ